MASARFHVGWPDLTFLNWRTGPATGGQVVATAAKSRTSARKERSPTIPITPQVGRWDGLPRRGNHFQTGSFTDISEVHYPSGTEPCLHLR